MDQVDRTVDTTRPWRYQGRAVRVEFPAANTTTEVLHGLPEVPDGFQWLDGDCWPTRAPGRQYTHDLAYLRSSVANSYAVLAFGMFREEPLNVQATG